MEKRTVFIAADGKMYDTYYETHIHEKSLYSAKHSFLVHKIHKMNTLELSNFLHDQIDEFLELHRLQKHYESKTELEDLS